MVILRVLCLLLGGFLMLLGVGVAAAGVVHKYAGGTGATTVSVETLDRSPGKLKKRLYYKKTVMTVAYKAYGNREAGTGQYWMAKLVLENEGKGLLKDIKISYRIPDWIGEWTTPDIAPELMPGQTFVYPIYPHFPARVATLRTRTPAEMQVRIQYTTGGETKEVVEKRPFEFRGINEIEYTSLPSEEIVNWYDQFDNSALIAAYSMDSDEAVQTYLSKISETMGGIDVPSNAKNVAETIYKIYNFQLRTGMTYAAAKGFPEKLGDVEAIVQNVRLPREVIQNNAGLCIELALLMCALCDASGAHSRLVLIPGHAYAVVQADDGSFVAFECTGVGGGRAGDKSTFAQALETGKKEFLQVLRGEVMGIVVDLRQHQSGGIRPPELPPIDKDALLRTLADRLREGGGTGAVNGGERRSQVVVTEKDAKAMPPVKVSIPILASWETDGALERAAKAAAPACKYMAHEESSGTYVQWYYVPTTNVDAFLDYLDATSSKLGLKYSFGKREKVRVDGRDSLKAPLGVMVANADFRGEMYGVPIKGGALYIIYAGPKDRSEELRDLIDRSMPKISIQEVN